ncbi:DUF397 domain-containing protein [[Actinomadura] parvosata]|uniref:DUF397 domain-containing protein n=1 Tax=[Actinomadura] parvosata TaxID=1955412 RepID=UPI00406D366C
MEEILTASWRRSSRCNNTGACVEVALLPGNRVAIRDSKNPQANPLILPADAYTSFIDGIKQQAH